MPFHEGNCGGWKQKLWNNNTTNNPYHAGFAHQDTPWALQLVVTYCFKCLWLTVVNHLWYFQYTLAGSKVHFFMYLVQCVAHGRGSCEHCNIPCEICTRYVSVVSGVIGHLSWWYSNVPGPLYDVQGILPYIYWLPNLEMYLNVYNMGMLYIVRIGYQCEFNCDCPFLQIGLPIMVIFRIGTYIYAFCIKFQCEFNCNAHFAIELPY